MSAAPLVKGPRRHRTSMQSQRTRWGREFVFGSPPVQISRDSWCFSKKAKPASYLSSYVFLNEMYSGADRLHFVAEWLVESNVRTRLQAAHVVRANAQVPLKVDIEGHGAEGLEGARDTLRKIRYVMFGPTLARKCRKPHAFCKAPDPMSSACGRGRSFRASSSSCVARSIRSGGGIANMKIRNFFAITTPVVLLLAAVASVDGLGLDRVFDRFKAPRKRDQQARSPRDHIRSSECSSGR
jgi:hypothetical protein